MTLCETRLDLNDEAGKDPDDVNFYVLMKICETQVGNLYFSKTVVAKKTDSKTILTVTEKIFFPITLRFVDISQQKFCNVKIFD
jgi:hypothetical protein